MTKMKKPKWPFVVGSLFGGALSYFLKQKMGSGGSASFDSPSSFSQPASSTAPRTPSSTSPTTPSSSSATARPADTSTGPATPHKPDNPNPDDLTLRDRVETDIFKNPETSREHININVIDGIVEIRGELPGQNAINALVQQVKAIPDVKGVHNYLHLPGTPAPNKETAIQAG